MSDNLPNFKIGNALYSAQQIVDKTLYANKTVTRIQGTTTVEIKKGQYVGKIYSWANLGGQLHFMLYGPNTTTYYFVLYDPAAFSQSAIDAQNALTVDEEQAAKDEAAKSWVDKLLEGMGLTNIGNTLKWAVPVFIVGSIGLKLWEQKNKAQSYKKISSNENK